MLLCPLPRLKHTSATYLLCQVSGEERCGVAGSRFPQECSRFRGVLTSALCPPARTGTQGQSLRQWRGHRARGGAGHRAAPRDRTQPGKGTSCLLALVSGLTFLADPKPLWTGLWGGRGSWAQEDLSPWPAGDEPSSPPLSFLLPLSRGEDRSLGPLWAKDRGQGLPGQPASSPRRDACLGSENV